MPQLIDMAREIDEIKAQRLSQILYLRRSQARLALYKALMRAVASADMLSEYGNMAAQLRCMREQVAADIEQH